MLMKSVLAVCTFALVSAALLWGQGKMGQQQGFTDCDLDIRPGDPNRQEVQVYWSEPQNVKYGMKFSLYCAQSDFVKVGHPDGSNEIFLKRGVENTVSFAYDEANKKVTIELCNVTPGIGTPPAVCPTVGPTEIPLVGEFKEILPLEMPTEQEVRKPSVNSERLLITGKNRGIEYSFTLTRYPQ